VRKIDKTRHTKIDKLFTTSKENVIVDYHIVASSSCFRINRTNGKNQQEK